jgi:hypothetical protein
MMTGDKERLEILDMIQKGSISAQEGLGLIEALEKSLNDIDENPPMDTFNSAPSPEPYDGSENTLQPSADDLNKWRQWWIIPFWLGIGITVSGGGLMYWAWSAKGVGIGFILSWIPFLLGVSLSVLGWNSRTGPWLHIRIQHRPDQETKRIAISLPLPVHFFAWSLRNFGHFIPGLNATGLDEIILALKDSAQAAEPLSINVQDGTDGEQVQVYIG